MKPVFTTTTTILLVLCALTVIALLVKREFFASSEIPEHVYELGEESWELASGQGIVLGESDAPVRIVVFYDIASALGMLGRPGLLFRLV